MIIAGTKNIKDSFIRTYLYFKILVSYIICFYYMMLIMVRKHSFYETNSKQAFLLLLFYKTIFIDSTKRVFLFLRIEFFFLKI